MTSASHILAIDQGTTSTRALVFDQNAVAIASAQKQFGQYYPESGWVEHDPEGIWQDTLTVCREAVTNAGLKFTDVAAIGITNQRETVVLWDRQTGEPVHRAIVWQDRRTADMCRRLHDEGYEDMVHARSGLLLDPYFSGTKLRWLLDNVEGVRARAERGELAFGTIDSFLLWRLTGGAVHATDATNASRTLMFNIHRQEWDDELLKMLDVPAAVLPEVKDSSDAFGETSTALFGTAIPITGIAGDQQAAMVGQACFEPGMGKSTYGTGCFLLMNVGSQAVTSQNRLLTTVAYRLNGQPVYALEGAIFVAGAAVQWLRDDLGIIQSASETAELASSVADTAGAYMVPAFTGLGAPHWDPDARGAILGLSRGTSKAHICRAALESVSYQTYDLVVSMRDDVEAAGLERDMTELRVDGGMVANEWLCQNLADTLALPVERPREIETTVLGAAFLAGLHVGLYPGLAHVATVWQRDRRFEPSLTETTRLQRLTGWRKAVARVLSEV